MSTVTPEQIDALLPQTQCGLCGYGGCMPYAEAIQFEHAPINLFPPGGVKTLRELGELLQQDPTSYIENGKKPIVLATSENQNVLVALYASLSRRYHLRQRQKCIL